MSTSLVQDPWPRQLQSRLAVDRWFKALSITAFVIGFFAAYFQLLNHPVYPVTVMPLTALDTWIGIHPITVLPYLSLWIYVFLVPVLLEDIREYRAYGIGVTTLAGIGLGAFLIWPTAIPPPGIDWTQHPMLVFLKKADAAGNACPSLHVAFAVLTAIWLERLLWKSNAPASVRLLNAGWCAVILYSTLATKQHVAVDALAGAALGVIGALSYPRNQDPRRVEAVHPVFNRQGLALFVAFGSKLTILALGIARTHPWLAGAMFFGPDLWILAGLLIANASPLMPVMTRFKTRAREVWLTIDDGPEPATTLAMLDLLDAHSARATFFLIGDKVAANPGLTRAILQRGHTLGNHTATHPLATFWCAGPRRTAREVDACNVAIEAAGASAPVWFRSPAGIKTFFLRHTLARNQNVLVGWTSRGCEQIDTSVTRPLERLKKHIRPGAIVLIHESARHGAQRIALLAALLEHLSANNYSCVLPEQTDLR